MGFYRSRVFPLLCDWAMRQPPLTALRKELLSGVVAPVLEIGLGSGLNLAHYPEAVHRMSAVEPNSALAWWAHERARSAGKRVEVHHTGAEEMPLPDASFQTVVSTWTLCSVASPESVVAEIFRVLAPGGRFLFIEHGLSDSPRVQRWQRRLNGLQQRLADGCRLTVDLESLLKPQPVERLELKKFYLRAAPKTHGFMRMGMAVKAHMAADQPIPNGGE